MRKFLSDLLSMLIVPALLVGHYLTDDSAFLFLYALLATVALMTYFLGLLGLTVMDDQNEKDRASLLSLADTLKMGFRRACGIAAAAGSFLYLSFTHHFALATLSIVASLLAWAFIAVVNERAKKIKDSTN